MCNTYISFVVMQKQKFVKREFTKNVLNSHIFVLYYITQILLQMKHILPQKHYFYKKIHPQSMEGS